MNSGSSNSNSSSDRGVVSVEVPYDVDCSHGRESTPVDIIVNCSRPRKVSSGKRLSTLVYEHMDTKNRRRQTPIFNGHVIRELRDGRKMSQDSLAELAGTTKANISKIERSETYVAISFDIFLALGKALYVAPEELARRLTEPPPRPPGSAPEPQRVDRRRN